MKVVFNQRIHDGPWGGGNKFTQSIARALVERGDEVAFDLASPDADIVVMTDTRARNPSLTFTPGAVLRYLLGANPRALVVHRINECDERKGTGSMNARLKLANYAADATVFIGDWLKELDLWRRESEAAVVRNGADPAVFNAKGNRPWDGAGSLKLVTHHWGAHRLKGFDVYELIDRLLGEEPWKDKIDFTYIGNLPAGFRFARARHVAPLDGEALAAALRAHHVYVTASVNEPAGMHHIEGAMSGLPILYRSSGALPEYCTGFGVAFAGPEDFEAALRAMTESYGTWRDELAQYPHTAERMCAGYLALFDGLLARRADILRRRRLWRNPLALALNQVPW